MSGTLGEIQKEHRRNSFSIRFATDQDALEFSQSEELKELNINLELDERILTIVIEDNSIGGQGLIDLLSQKQIVPEKFEAMEPTLESLFTEVVR